jgi:glycosyltransferase involved in cell wall biosynthesis
MDCATLPILIGSTGVRCLFLAPLKPPDHLVPSGDRLIARQFMGLLDGLGFKVDLVSRLRTRCATPEDLPELVAAAKIELERCISLENQASDNAALVFTYHNYYRAPDLIGPALARELGLPYVIAESSRSPHRVDGIWAEGHRLAEAASDAAAMIITPTAHDKVMLDRLRPPSQTVMHLKPFLDLSGWPSAETPLKIRSSGSVRLLTIAMMRLGNKVQSYAALASILGKLTVVDWTMDIVGDGEGRSEVEAHFAPFGNRVYFHGAFDDRARMATLLQASDIFVWPAIEEPIGMVFLEAQAHGLPCIAFGYRGVPDVVEDCVSGFVIPPGDDALFVTRLGELIENSELAAQLGASARRNFDKRHSTKTAMQKTADAFTSAGLPLPRH